MSAPENVWLSSAEMDVLAEVLTARIGVDASAERSSDPALLSLAEKTVLAMAYSAAGVTVKNIRLGSAR